jgi:hypothetical protein
VLRRFWPAALPRAGTGPAENPLTGWARRAEAYVPRPFAGRLTLLFPRDTGPIGGRGWQGLAPRVAIRTIAGNHLTCITEHLNDTAQALADVLAED